VTIIERVLVAWFLYLIVFAAALPLGPHAVIMATAFFFGPDMCC